MHKRIQMRPQMQDYRNRDYCLHMMDQRIFDEMCGTDDLFLMTSGCLDALSLIPAGSTKECGQYFDQFMNERGVSLAETLEREEFTKRLLAELAQED